MGNGDSRKKKERKNDYFNEIFKWEFKINNE